MTCLRRLNAGLARGPPHSAHVTHACVSQLLEDKREVRWFWFQGNNYKYPPAAVKLAQESHGACSGHLIGRFLPPIHKLVTQQPPGQPEGCVVVMTSEYPSPRIPEVPQGVAVCLFCGVEAEPKITSSGIRGFVSFVFFFKSGSTTNSPSQFLGQAGRWLPASEKVLGSTPPRGSAWSLTPTMERVVVLIASGTGVLYISVDIVSCLMSHQAFCLNRSIGELGGRGRGPPGHSTAQLKPFPQDSHGVLAVAGLQLCHPRTTQNAHND